MEPVPKQENPCWPMRIGDAAVRRRISSRAAYSFSLSWTLTLPLPSTVRYLSFFAAKQKPIPVRPAAWCLSTMRAEKATPFSAAGPMVATDPLPSASKLKTVAVSCPQNSPASTIRTRSSSISIPQGLSDWPVITIPSHPARFN